MAPRIGATTATTISEIDAPSPHSKSARCVSPTTTLPKYRAYSTVTITVVNAESATSYMHQPRISVRVTGGFGLEDSESVSTLTCRPLASGRRPRDHVPNHGRAVRERR